MRFFTARKDFLKALQISQKAIGNSSQLPVLGNFLIETEGQNLKISATNLEFSVICKTTAEIKNEGKITIPAKILTNWLNFQKDEEIELKVLEGETVEIKTKTSQTKIKGIPADEFPELPGVQKAEEISLTAENLSQSISEVAFSCAHSAIRPVLSGVLLFSKGKNLNFAATDSYRLAEKKVELEKEPKSEIYSIVPARTMIELERILSGLENSEEIKIQISKNQISFSAGKIQIISRLIEGKFPDYQQIIPTEKKTIISVDKEDFSLAIKRVGIFAKENNNNISISTEKDLIKITTKETEVGGEISEVAAKITGEKNEVFLNGQFILDVLNVLKSDEIKITINEKISPAIFSGKDSENFTYVVMPLKN